ncbi:GH25 family lysozyme [Lactococcus nasutitermitis]|uniref:GH25 family lysozyme n=1 Tax=Lactococcus nasutitermitis TaxID=1652957 RepID=A0ABV9JGI5_9LACT|nr:GH25 family lysozyme [Lactococcus nasutitermitis]
MKTKLKSIFLLTTVLLTVLPLQQISAETSENIENNNHPMGYYTGGYRTPEMKRARASAPSNLTSNDSSLPRKDAIDIASYQSWMTQSDFNQLKAQGVKTVIIKLTEGTYYQNPYAKSHIQMARNAGLNIATYHFAIFGNTSNQTSANNAATNEATYYANMAKSLGLTNSTVMIEDAEYSGTASGVWNQASQNFTNRLKNQGYSNIRYYASKSWVESKIINPTTFGNKNMWVAQYLYGKPSNTNLQNTQYGAWQYTSQMYFTNFSAQKPIDTNIDYGNIFKAPAASTTHQEVYRMYNPNSGEHFYTTNSYEATQLSKTGWHHEGIGWESPLTKNNPVYRLYNKNGGYHFYTLNNNEKNKLVSLGWRYEGVSFYTGGNSSIYRSYNPNNGMHNYTLNSYEHTQLVKFGWKNEGTAWKVK